MGRQSWKYYEKGYFYAVFAGVFFCNFEKNCNKSPKALKKNSFGPKHCFLGLLSHFLCKSLVIEGLISKQFSQTIRVFFLNKLRVKRLESKITRQIPQSTYHKLQWSVWCKWYSCKKCRLFLLYYLVYLCWLYSLVAHWSLPGKGSSAVLCSKVLVFDVFPLVV